MKYNDDPRITAYLFDELDPDERREFETELERSSALRELLESTRHTIEQLKNELDEEERPVLTAEQRAQIASAIPSTSPKPASSANFSSKPFRHRAWWYAAAVGIAVCFVIAVSPWMTGFEREIAHSQLQQAERLHEMPASAVDVSAAQTTESNFVREKARLIHSSSDRKLSVLAGLQEQNAVEFRISLEHQSGNDAGAKALAGLALEADETAPSDQGVGPGQGGDKFDLIVENAFVRVADAPLSTFSIDVDTASYSKVRMFLQDHNSLPRPDAVRIEELVNYFTYDYGGPDGTHPFAAHLAAASCPWNPKHHLVRIGIKGREIPRDERPPSNLVFLLDVSGSMDQPNKLPLLRAGMKMLVDQLSESDRVAIVVYASAAGMVLDSTTADQKSTIVEALDRLHAGGSTNGGDGIRLAYATALDHFIKGGVNRVILCTDGDFNVGTTGTDELIRIVEENAKDNVFLTVLGFGMGNHNDAMLEQISNKGNGNYAMVDTVNEARKVLVQQTSSTLVTIAKDVKIQVEFNPQQVAAYRLIGYENRLLAAQDFNDDTKDAGEIGAGHTVTALYEIVPASEALDVAIPSVDELKYQTAGRPTEAAHRDELLTVKLRYKQPDGNHSKLMSVPLERNVASFNQADRDFQFAAAVASFGMLLRNSEHKGSATFASVLEIASPAAVDDADGYRVEFLELVRTAASLAGESLPPK